MLVIIMHEDCEIFFVFLLCLSFSVFDSFSYSPTAHAYRVARRLMLTIKLMFVLKPNFKLLTLSFGSIKSLKTSMPSINYSDQHEIIYKVFFILGLN